MSHSLCTHAVMLTVFNLVSTTPRFHHPFCLRARPLGLKLLYGDSSSIPSSAVGSPCFFLLRLFFHRRQFFPRVQTLLVCSPLSLVALGSTQPNLYVSGLCVRITPAPLHPGHPTKGQLVLVRFPRTGLFLCLHLGRSDEPPPPTLLAAVPPRVGIVELTAPSTLVTGTPPLLAAPCDLLPFEWTLPYYARSSLSYFVRGCVHRSLSSSSC